MLGDYPPEVWREANRHLAGLPSLAPGWAGFAADPGDVPLCPQCGRNYSTQGMDDVWRCRWCDPATAKQRGELTLRIIKLRAEILKRHPPRNRPAERRVVEDGEQ